MFYSDFGSGLMSGTQKSGALELILNDRSINTYKVDMEYNQRYSLNHVLLSEHHYQFQLPSAVKMDGIYVKFIYSEKATKFCEIFTLLLSGTT